MKKEDRNCCSAGLSVKNCFVFLLLFLCQISFGQNGVTITSPQSPGPTSTSPIEFFLSFKDAVNHSIRNDLIIQNGTVLSEIRLNPDFEFIVKEDLPTVNVSANALDFLFSGLPIDKYIANKLRNVIVAFDINSNNDIIYLTYGNGVFKFRPGQSDVQLIPDQFQLPIDMVIDNQDRILIADNESYSVEVYETNFSSSYSKLYTIGGAKGKDGNEFYGPTGLAVNQKDVLYVADSYSGSDPAGIDQIKLYNIGQTNAPFIKSYGDAFLNNPFRITVDKNNTVYVSDSGGNNGRIQIFDSTDTYRNTISSQSNRSPGSLVVDSFGYLYSVDYRGDLSFNDIYQNPENFLDDYDQIKNSIYPVIVYLPLDDNYDTSEIGTLGNNSNLPVDLALNSCENIEVLNLKLGGYADIGKLDVDASLDFDILKFRRNDNFKIEVKPIVTDNVKVKVDGSGFFICDSQPQGVLSIEYAPIQDHPEAICKDVTIELDENGQATITAKQIYGGTENLELSIDKNTFSCNDIGEQTVTLTVKDPDTGLTDSCEAVVTVFDLLAPEFENCPGPIDIELNEGEVYSVPKFYLDVKAFDNCSIRSLIQNPPGETEFSEAGEYIVDITATDPSGNENVCSIKINITVNPRPFTCKENASVFLQLDETGKAQLKLSDIIDITGDTSGYNFDWKKDFTCDDIGENAVPLTVIDSDNEVSASCTAIVTVKDTISPHFVSECPDNITAPFHRDIGYEIEDYSFRFSAEDNCDSDLTFTQSPAPGSIVYEDQTIELMYTDDSGNSDGCSFELDLTETSDIMISCNSPVFLQADEECRFFVPDLSEEVAIYPSNATVSQSIEAGTEIFEDTDVVMTVTSVQGDNSDSCIITLKLVDYIYPEVTSCLQSFEVTVPPGGSFELPDYRDQVTATDNCEIVRVTQNPEPGTIITEDTQIRIDFFDAFDNYDFCAFNIRIQEDEVALPFTCKSSISVQLDENGEAHLDAEDYFNGTDGLSGYSFSAEKTDFDCSDAEAVQQVEVSYSGEQSGSCVVEVEVIDFLPPVFDCPETLDINVPVGQTETVVNFEAPSFSDNCSATVTQTGGLTSGSEFDLGEHEVEFTATDPAGNESICSFTIRVQQLENMPPSAKNDRYSTDKNTSLTINAPGVLANDSDPEGDDLVAVLLQQPANGQVELQEDGSFVYVPNTDFSGEDSFIYYAGDGSGEGEATVTINVRDNTGGFSCIQHLSVEVGEEGNATISVEDLYSGNAEGLEISASPLTFSCDDIGDTSITLTYQGRLNGSCEIPVSVYDGSFPVLKLKDVSIDLNPVNGMATIDFEDVDNGSYDNCDKNVTYSLSQSVFSCKNVGENSVIVTAEDSSGNLSTGEITVKVFAEAGICDEPVEGSEYIFIYPNPNSGQFKIATPADISISRIEVFDNRGRFITAKNYAETGHLYEMNLGPLQEAVYVLKLTTNEGEVMKRFIFKN